jgi:hypothetical protein
VRRHAVWLVTLPVVLAGIEAAHAVANRLVGAPDGELFSNTTSGRPLLPWLVLAGAAALLGALAARAGGLWGGARRGRLVAVPFGVLPPLGFVALEAVESLVHGWGGWHGLVRPAFALGLALQAPIGLVGYLLARGLLRLSDETRARLLRDGPRTLRVRRAGGGRPPAPVFLPPAGLPGATHPGRAPPAAARPG